MKERLSIEALRIYKEIMETINSTFDERESLILKSKLGREKKSHSEVAQILNISPKLVKQIERRALRKLYKIEKVRKLFMRWGEIEIKDYKIDKKERMKIGSLNLVRIDYMLPNDISYSDFSKKLDEKFNVASKEDKGITFIISDPTLYRKVYPIPSPDLKNIKSPMHIFLHTNSEIVDEIITIATLSPKISLIDYHKINDVLKKIDTIIKIFPTKGKCSKFLYIEPKMDIGFFKDYSIEKSFIKMKNIVKKATNLEWWFPYWYVNFLIAPGFLSNPLEMLTIINSEALAKKFKSELEKSQLPMPDILLDIITLLRCFRWPTYRISSLKSTPFERYSISEYLNFKKRGGLLLKDLIELNDNFLKNYENWADIHQRGKHELKELSKESDEILSKFKPDSSIKKDIEIYENRYGWSFIKKAGEEIKSNLDELNGILERTKDKQISISNYIQRLLNIKLSHINIDVQKSIKFFTFIILILTIILAWLTLILNIDAIKTIIN